MTNICVNIQYLVFVSRDFLVNLQEKESVKRKDEESKPD